MRRRIGWLLWKAGLFLMKYGSHLALTRTAHRDTSTSEHIVAGHRAW